MLINEIMTKEGYIKRIQDNFPKLKFNKSEFITTGWDDDVIVLDKKIVFSFPKQKLDCQEKFQKELNIMPVLNKAITLSVPDFIYIPKDKSFAGYKYIDGVPFSNNIFKKLTATQKEICARQLAQFLSELHSCSVSRAKKGGATNAWCEQEARDYYVKRAQTVFNRLGYDFTHLKKLLERHPLKDTNKRSVVHQDFTSDHILYDTKSKKIAGIIDFGDVQIADPAIDFSKLWDYSEEFINSVLYFYKGNDTDLKDRSYRWWIYHNINLIEFGYSKKKEGMIKIGYKRLQNM